MKIALLAELAVRERLVHGGVKLSLIVLTVPKCLLILPNFRIMAADQSRTISAFSEIVAMDSSGARKTKWNSVVVPADDKRLDLR